MNIIWSRILAKFRFVRRGFKCYELRLTYEHYTVQNQEEQSVEIPSPRSVVYVRKILYWLGGVEIF